MPCMSMAGALSDQGSSSHEHTIHAAFCCGSRTSSTDMQVYALFVRDEVSNSWMESKVSKALLAQALPVYSLQLFSTAHLEVFPSAVTTW